MKIWLAFLARSVRGYEKPPAANATEDRLGLNLEGITLETVAAVVFPIALAADITNTFTGRGKLVQRGENDLADTAIGVLAVIRGMKKLKN